ncbi:MAG: ABC transporter permease [Bacteroidia bacterium]|nr:ABC transporter permease [Bacteroidia bacterium]
MEHHSAKKYPAGDARTEFGAFVRKEFTHILRDPRTMLILFITPVVLILLFSYAISTEIRNVDVAVLMPERDAALSSLVEKIDASEYFRVTGTLTSPEQAERIFRRGEADIVLSFEKGFSSAGISADGTGIGIIADASNPNTAATETMYLSAIIGEWLSAQAAGGAAAVSSGLSGESSGITAAPRAAVGTLSGNVHMLYNPQLRSSYNFVPGIMGLILMLICALMTSVSIVREKENGTMEVLLVSPVKALTIIIAKMIPYFTMACLDLAIVLLMSKFVLGMPMSGSLFWIIASSVVYIILGLSIGLLVSNIVKSQVAASLVCAIGFLFPMLMLSGMMFPIESMPAFFRWISTVIPARWYVVLLRRLMIQGTGFVFVAKEFAILCTMTLAVAGFALKTFNDKLE